LIVGNFIGVPSASIAPHMNTIYSDNSTYTVNVAGTGTHANLLSLKSLLAVDWQTDLIHTAGQTAKLPGSMPPTQIPIDVASVGGYFTASGATQPDNSIAAYGGAAGTNLRWAEALWEISMGLSLTELAAGTPAQSNVPAFVPAGDPNFFTGTGQPACMSCHGTGASAL
jgi:hypothetical protein